MKLHLPHEEGRTRELKNRLSAYIREVRSGKTVFVTDRGEVVAELIPPGRRANGRREASRLEILARTGFLVRGTANDPAVYPKLSPALKHEKSSRLLDQERGGR